MIDDAELLRSGRSSLPDKKISFQRSPAGWQFPITDAMIDRIPATLEERSMYVPPRGG